MMMIKNILFYLFMFACLFLNIEKSSAQKQFQSFPFDTTQSYVIEVKDGSSYAGKLLYADSLIIAMQTEVFIRLEIPLSNIIKVKIIKPSSIKKGKYWFDNPFATKYLISPSAIPLEPGKGYYQNTYILLQSFNVGVTKNFSIGGGVEFISTFLIKDPKPIYFITPKVSFKLKEKLHAGAGVYYVSIPDFDNERFHGGITYGMLTYGTMDHNITGAGGFAFDALDFSEIPLFSISGMTRFSRQAAFISENWVVTGENSDLVYSYGVRFFSERLMIDLCLVNSGEMAKEIFIGLPFIDVAVRF